MPVEELKTIYVRSVDLERLGVQIAHWTGDDPELRQECKDNAEKIARLFVPKKPKYDKLGPDDVLWGADDNCDHEIMYPPGGGMKCHKCGGWFCY